MGPESLMPFVTQIASQGSNALEGAVRNFLVGRVADRLLSPVLRGIIRAFNPDWRSDAERQRDRIEVLDRVLQSLVRVYSADGGSDIARYACDDSAVESFVVDALESALDSPFDAKQVLLGQLIGQRLNVATESREDMLLREALRIVRSANREHLFALATLYLVHRPPVRKAPTETLITWWDTEYLPILKRVVYGWNRDDMEYLERLGALMIDRSVDQPALRLEGRGGPAIDHVFFSRGLGPPVSLSSDNRYRSEFAVYVSHLHHGTASSHEYMGPGFPLYGFALTEPGVHVAATIVEAVTRPANSSAAGGSARPRESA